MTSRNKHFYYYYLGDYSPGYTLVTEKTEWMLNSNFQNGVLTLFKILKWCWWCKSRHKGDKMTKALKNHIDCSEMKNAIQECKRCNRPVTIPWRNTIPFQELIEDHFRVDVKRNGDHFGVDLGIISGLGTISGSGSFRESCTALGSKPPLVTRIALACVASVSS